MRWEGYLFSIEEMDKTCGYFLIYSKTPIQHFGCQPHIYTMMASSNGNISALLALCEGNSPVTGEFP